MQRLVRPPQLGLALAPVVIYLLLNGLTNRVVFEISPVLFWAVDCVFVVLLPAAILCLLSRRGVRTADYGLNSFDVSVNFIGTSVLFVILLSAAYTASQYVTWVLLWATGNEHLAQVRFTYPEVFPTGWLRAPAAIYLALSAGIIESVFFIGLPWLAWRSHFGHWGKFLFSFTSSMVFAAVHWEQGLLGASAAFAFGLVACALFLKVRDLWPVVAAHTLVDLVHFW